MKAILMSIQPKWCEKIVNGEKTIEVRKTRPKLETPFKVYIYCTKGKEVLVTDKVVSWTKEVIGEFVCDMIEEFTVGSLKCDDIEALACLSHSEMIDYFYKPQELDGKTVKIGYAWHISDLKIYDKPKELGENGDFKFPCLRGGEDFDTHRKCVGCKYARLWTGTREIYCDRWVTRAPQSWCYVEELED